MANEIYDSEGPIKVDAPKGDVVAVYDPNTKSLRAADKATAASLAEEGYATGPEAQALALREGATAKLAGFAAKFGSAGSMGLSDLLSAKLGMKEGLSGVDNFAEDHPYIAGAGSLLGYGANYAKGFGQLGVGLAARGAEAGAEVISKSALPALLKVAGKAATTIGAHVALPGAAAAAVEGTTRELTREALLKDPVNLEQIASSALTNVMWNSVGNTIGYAIGRTPAFLRARGGDVADFLEKTGFHEVQLKKVAPAAEEGPRLTRATISAEHGFEDSVTSQELHRTESIDDIKDRLQTEEMSTATIKRNASAAEESTTKTATTTKQSASGRAAKDAAAVEDALKAAEPTDLGEIKPVFNWPTGYNKDAKKAVLRRMIKHRLKDDPTHRAMWDEVFKNEQEIQKLDAAVKSGEFDAEKVAPLKTQLIREKEEYKEFLAKAVPREIRGDKFVPGFQDLNEEYGRVVGNPRNDLAEPDFAPSIPKAKVAGPTERASSSTSETKVDTSKYKVASSEADSATASTKTKTDQSTRDYDKAVEQTQSTTSSKDRGKYKATATFTFPKKPPEYVRVGIKQPFSSNTIKDTLISGNLIPGGGAVANKAAAYMVARNSLAFAASHREGIGNFVEGIGKYTTKGIPLIKAATQTYAQRGRVDGVAPTINLASYEKAADVINAAATNPQAVQSYVERAYPGLTQTNPQAAAQISTTIMRAAGALNASMPKRPYTATLKDTPFRPTRAQQVRMLSRWQILANPQKALQTGDPQTIQMLREVYPAWYEAQVNRLMKDTQAHPGPISSHAARNITAFTGAPVYPRNNAQALKRMQATAGPMPQQNAGPQGSAGRQSTKTANAAAQRDNPSFELD